MAIDYAIVLSSSETAKFENDPIRNVAETLSFLGGSKYFDRWHVENNIGPHITLINVRGDDSNTAANAEIEKFMISAVDRRAPLWNAIQANFGELSIIGLNGQSLEKVMLATRPKYGEVVKQIQAYNEDLTKEADQNSLAIEPDYYRADKGYYPNVTVVKEDVLTEGFPCAASDVSQVERKSHMMDLFARVAIQFAGHQRLFDQVDVIRLNTQAGKLTSAKIVHRVGLGSR